MAIDKAVFDTSVVVGHLIDRAERMVAGVPLLLLAMLVLWAAWFLGDWLSRRAVLERVSRRNPFLQDLVRAAVRWGVVLAGALVALEIVGATKMVGAVLGTAGVLGVALGFAFKDILENYLAGLLLSLRQPFAPQDHVVIDGNEGIVVALTSRATILMTLDGNHLRLPNATVFRGVILNYTRNPKRRVSITVGIGVDEDIRHAQHVGMQALGAVPGMLPDPPPRALVRELADWSVVVEFLAWMDQSSHEFRLVESEAARMIKEAMDAAGVDMPYPTYRVRAPSTAAGLEHADEEPAAAPKGTAPRELRPAADTRKTDDVLAQVQEQRRENGGTDLLSGNAPQEFD